MRATIRRGGAASPKSANQTSPGCGLTEQVEDLLFDSTRARHIENVAVREFGDLGYTLPYLSRVSGFHSRSLASSISANASTTVPSSHSATADRRRKRAATWAPAPVAYARVGDCGAKWSLEGAPISRKAVWPEH